MSGESSSARPCGRAGVGDELKRSGRAWPAGGPRQPRQDAVALERREVVRVKGEHGRPGRRPQHPGRADDRADKAVDERRLAGPGGAADDDQRRSVDLPQARQQVVVHLSDQVVPDAPSIFRAGDIQFEPDRAEVVAKPLERPGQVGGHGRVVPAQRRAEACAAR